RRGKRRGRRRCCHRGGAGGDIRNNHDSSNSISWRAGWHGVRNDRNVGWWFYSRDRPSCCSWRGYRRQCLGSRLVVKLARVLMLAPVVSILSLQKRRRGMGRQAAGEGKRPPIVPLFVIGFLVMVFIRSTMQLP